MSWNGQLWCSVGRNETRGYISGYNVASSARIPFVKVNTTTWCPRCATIPPCGVSCCACGDHGRSIFSVEIGGVVFTFTREIYRLTKRPSLTPFPHAKNTPVPHARRCWLQLSVKRKLVHFITIRWFRLPFFGLNSAKSLKGALQLLSNRSK